MESDDSPQNDNPFYEHPDSHPHEHPKNAQQFEQPARVYSPRGETKEFAIDPIDDDDLQVVEEAHINQAIEDGILPRFSGNRAFGQRDRLSRIAQGYATYRRFGFSVTESRIRAEHRVANEDELSRSHCKVLYDRVNPTSSENTEWMEDRLEQFWAWWSNRYDPLPDLTGLRDSCYRIRQALLDLRSVSTPALGIEDFTPQDFIEAGDEYILSSLQGTRRQLKNGLLSDQPAKLDGASFAKPHEITQYDVPWANSWISVLDIINEHLERVHKEDDAVEIANPIDCTEAYAEWENGGRKYYDVSLAVNYQPNGDMRITADIWLPWKGEDEQIGFYVTGTDYPEEAVNELIVQALQEAERTAPAVIDEIAV